jgi:hypothetical protein
LADQLYNVGNSLDFSHLNYQQNLVVPYQYYCFC